MHLLKPILAGIAVGLVFGASGFAIAHPKDFSGTDNADNIFPGTGLKDTHEHEDTVHAEAGSDSVGGGDGADNL